MPNKPIIPAGENVAILTLLRSVGNNMKVAAVKDMQAGLIVSFIATVGIVKH